MFHGILLKKGDIPAIKSIKLSTVEYPAS